MRQIIDFLKRRLAEEKGLDVCQFTDVLVDYFLWGFRREKADEMDKFPFHKTRSVYY